MESAPTIFEGIQSPLDLSGYKHAHEGHKCPLQRSRGEMVFSGKAKMLSERSEFIFVPKKLFDRGKPQAKLWGDFFWYFSYKRKVQPF